MVPTTASISVSNTTKNIVAAIKDYNKTILFFSYYFRSKPYFSINNCGGVRKERKVEVNYRKEVLQELEAFLT
jgi:hypothetical protein